ncbi:MAG: DUF3857 domain-containing protein [Acidobacteria bacterium]|nr:DUF3857 domain-containing protein [Acidobacteriota bacterium]
MRKSLVVLALAALCTALPAKVEMGKWAVFTPNELSMTDTHVAPGAKAIFLFRHAEVIGGVYSYHAAIKVLNDAGRDCANFQVPENTRKILARTVRPDGTSVELQKDDIMKKVVAKKKGNKSQMKVFALPDVSAGSIVEVFLQAPLEQIQMVVFSWPFQEDQLASLDSWIEFDQGDVRLYNNFVVDTYRQASTRRTEESGGRIRYSAVNVPPEPEDDFLPPGEELRVYFFRYYAFQQVENASSLDLKTREGQARYIELFWNQFGKELGKRTYEFIKSKEAVNKLRDTILGGQPAGEDAARKIYDYVVRNFKNTSFLREGEEERAAKEKSKEKVKRSGPRRRRARRRRRRTRRWTTSSRTARATGETSCCSAPRSSAPPTWTLTRPGPAGATTPTSGGRSCSTSSTSRWWPSRTRAAGATWTPPPRTATTGRWRGTSRTPTSSSSPPRAPRSCWPPREKPSRTGWFAPSRAPSRGGPSRESSGSTTLETPTS